MPMIKSTKNISPVISEPNIAVYTVACILEYQETIGLLRQWKMPISDTSAKIS
jgi:hypothetical protein